MSAVGVGAGLCVHVTAAILGLSAILLSSALAYEAVRWAGAAYLVFLGIRSLFSRSSGESTNVSDHTLSNRPINRAFRKGLPEVRILPIMTPILAKVTAIEKRGDQYQVIVQISPRYRGSFNTLAFGEIKLHSGSLKDGRLDLVYYQDPGLNIGDPFPLWTLH
jgi:hypothetical protein